MTDTGQKAVRDWPTIAKRIKTLREARNMTQPELAAAIGRHRATIARIESGVPITDGVLHLIAQALNTPLSIVIDSTDPSVTIARLGGPISDALQRDQAMKSVLDLAKALAATILGWENIGDATIPLGEVMKANRKAHELEVALKESEQTFGPDYWKEDPSGEFRNTGRISGANPVFNRDGAGPSRIQ